MLTTGIDTLLDLARAEAKRSGDPQPGAIHLALVLLDREPERFKEVFDQKVIDDLTSRRASGVSLASGEDLDEFVAKAEDNGVDGLLKQLHRELPELLETTADSAEPPAGASEPASGEGSPPPATHRLLADIEVDPTILGHEATTSRILAQLTRRHPANVLLHGESGSGKTSAVTQLASTVNSDEYSGPLAGCRFRRVRVSLILEDDPVNGLDAALDAAVDDEVLVLDDLESLMGLGGQSVYTALLLRLRAALIDPERRVILVVEDRYRDRIDALDSELYGHMIPIALEPLAAERIHEIARTNAEELEALHEVEIPDSVALLAAAPGSQRDRLVHPGLAVARLETAASFASLREDRIVLESDLSVTNDAPIESIDSKGMVERLRERVKGQDLILDRVATRLALTRANLDLRPERPDSVFLFVGPTGVGKTELARALCETVFGDESRMIRLDMSEYAQEWALSRLIGPQAGYVGSDQPSGWLTTRVAAQPQSLILLDEIEKADPVVWNTFLQVFDAGRLSDSRGTIADFSKTVIIMTSNIGATAFGSKPFGFADEVSATEERARGREAVLSEVRQRMAPELINRMDDILVFDPLSEESISEIAFVEVKNLRSELESRGFEIEIPDDVVTLLANSGYDPAYGARHLQRNLEKMLLEPLASAGSRSVRATVRDGCVAWEALSSRGG